MAEAVRNMEIVVVAIDRATRDVQKIVREVTRETEKASKAAKVSIEAEDHATAEIRRVQAQADKLFGVFSQPLSITVRDFATAQIAKISAALAALRAKAIIPPGLGTGAAAIGLGAGALLAGGIGLGIAKSVDDAADLEAAMLRVNKLVGFDETAEGGKAAIKGLENDIQRMMIGMGMPLEEVVQAYERAGAAGIGEEFKKAGNFEAARDEIEGYVQISLQAASAFKMPAEATTQYLGIIANNYKPAGVAVNEYLKHVASGIDAVADSTLASEEDLLVYMSGITSITAQMTKSADVDKFFMTMGAALKGTGLSANEAATATERLFKNAKLHSADLSKMLGMGQEEFLVTLKERPQEIFQELVNYYKSLPITQQAEFTKLFGIEGGPVFEKAAGEKWDEIWGTAEDALGPSYDAGTRIKESFDNSRKGLLQEIATFRQIFSVLRQGVGAGPADMLGSLLHVVNSLIRPLVLMVDTLMGLEIPGGKYMAWAALFAVMASAVSFMIPLLSGLVVKFGLVAAAQGVVTMWTNILSLSIKGLARSMVMLVVSNPITAILALAAGVVLLLYKTGYLQKAWDKFVNSPVGEDLKAFMELIKGGAGAAFGAINAKWEIVSPEVKEIMGKIVDLLGGAFLLMIDAQLKYLEIIIAIIRKIWGFGEILWGWLSKVVTFLKEFSLEGLKDAIVTALGGTPGTEAGSDEHRAAWEKALAEMSPTLGAQIREGTYSPEDVDKLYQYSIGAAGIGDLWGVSSPFGTPALRDAREAADRAENGTSPVDAKLSPILRPLETVAKKQAELDRIESEVGSETGLTPGWKVDPFTNELVRSYTDAAGTAFLEGSKEYKAANDLFLGKQAETRGSHAAGTQYIPKTGAYFLHQGERVVSAAQNRLGAGSQNITVNVPVHIDRVSNDAEARRLDSMIRRAAKEAVKEAVAQRRT